MYVSGSGTYEARYGLWFSIRISPSRGWLPVCVGHGREVIVSGAAHEARVRRRHGRRGNALGSQLGGLSQACEARPRPVVLTLHRPCMRGEHHAHAHAPTGPGGFSDASVVAHARAVDGLRPHRGARRDAVRVEHQVGEVRRRRRERAAAHLCPGGEEGGVEGVAWGVRGEGARPENGCT